MDPGHTMPVPSVLTGQPSQPRVQEQTSPSVGSEHVDSGLGGQSPTHSTTEKPLLGSSEGHSPPRDRNGARLDFETINPQTPLPARSRDGHAFIRGLSRRTGMGGHAPSTSGLDYLVPVMEKPHVCLIFFALLP